MPKAGPRAFALLIGAIMTTAPLHAGGEGAGILTGRYTAAQVRGHLRPIRDWHPFPRAADRAAWQSLPAAVRTAYVREAEKHLHAAWPVLTATEFLDYVRTGNRTRYQDLSFGRRGLLATFVIAECIDGGGRFRDDIINGIWAICEETYWGVPAHVGAQKRGPGLPDATEPTVDLFAAETASLLAWTYYLLQDSLDAVSPRVAERIRFEIDRRVNGPNLERDDFWWMGKTRAVNNWTPWICSNWLAAALICEPDSSRRAQSVYKILQCLDRFLGGYADDGGCDEGPSYWGRAGGSLFDCLELLFSCTDGYVDVFSVPRVKEIGRYIARAHVTGPWFVNFADASAKIRPDAPTIYRYGRAIGDGMLAGFGAFLAREESLGRGMLPGQFGVLGRALPGLFVLNELLAAGRTDALLRDSWFPGIQVMMARSEEGSSQGLFVAAQAGHNDESHNHNDVGNFVVYLDGEPVLIDVGVETYTAKTFSAERYSIWTMRSSYHNLPTIGGAEQAGGRKFAARDVSYRASDASARLTMDIAGAYPDSAGIRAWKRIVTLNRSREVVVSDEYDLARGEPGGIVFSLMTCREPDFRHPGVVRLGAGSPAAVLEFDATLAEASAEPIVVSDPQLQSCWGSSLWRILLTLKSPERRGSFAVRIRRE
jgi:hypothetical protein